MINYFTLDDLVFDMARQLEGVNAAHINAMIEIFAHNEHCSVSADFGTIIDRFDTYIVEEFVVYVNDTKYFILVTYDKNDNCKVKVSNAFNCINNLIC